MTVSAARGVSYVNERELSININETPAITNGIGKSYYPIQTEGTIVGWRIAGNTSGTITVKILKAYQVNPTFTDEISGSNPPMLSSQTQNSSNDLSSWSSRTVRKGDTLGVNIQNSSGLSSVVITLLME